MSEATKLLTNSIRLPRGQKAIIAVEENSRLNDLEVLTICRSDLHVHTNRFELAMLFKRKGFECVRFSDFDFSSYADASIDMFAHRVGKDKALTHYLINQAKRLLKPGGQLILSGMRQEGTKTYVAKAGEILGTTPVSTTRRSGARIGKIQKSADCDASLLDDKTYGQLREIELDKETRMQSKPGIFGWNKIDQGSKFLVENAPRLDGKTVLDLGCGYGYLSLHAHRSGASRIVATDNNAAALAACHENLNALGKAFELSSGDAGNEIDETFDAIWCNPPFHQGVKANAGLTAKFVRSLNRLLKEDGYALVVVNAFITFEKSAADHFAEITEVANNKSFKVLRLAKPIQPTPKPAPVARKVIED